MSNENEVWYSEYDLRQFIDMAVRYKIEGVFKSRTKSQPFSVFSFFVENARNNFDLFANQLNTKLTQNENWKAIEIDVKYRFLPMLNQYLNWYKENKTELEKFQPLCPYSIMLSVIESTKAVILEYFPENDTMQKSNSENQMGRTQKSKLDFTKDKLKPTVLELANLDGYEKPSTYLNDLLKEVKQFNDIEFEGDFFLKIHYLCQEFADKFWSEGHRKDITEWLNKAPVITEVFKTTWGKLPTQPTNSQTNTEKYTAKHYLLAFLIECNAKGESYPIGNKKELERIGNERMGVGKGNRFYKVFNSVINKDLNAEKNLFEIGGEYWRKAVIELSKDPELVENYLQSKQL